MRDEPGVGNPRLAPEAIRFHREGMRYLWLVLFVAAPLSAQQAPRWEYGTLELKITAGSAVPGDWSAGDSTVQGVYLLEAAREHQGKRHGANAIVVVLNLLGADGWELVDITAIGMIFRRRKT